MVTGPTAPTNPTFAGLACVSPELPLMLVCLGYHQEKSRYSNSSSHFCSSTNLNYLNIWSFTGLLPMWHKEVLQNAQMNQNCNGLESRLGPFFRRNSTWSRDVKSKKRWMIMMFLNEEWWLVGWLVWKRGAGGYRISITLSASDCLFEIKLWSSLSPAY